MTGVQTCALPILEEFTAEQAAELARGYAEGGEKLSEACKRAAKATGVPKQEIYKLLMNE